MTTKIIKILYLIAAGLDRNFSQWLLLNLVEAMYDHAGKLEVGDC